MRLDPVFEARPWYLTDGLLHYVGVHSQSTLGAIWGACFAVNRDFARASGIRFSTRLGRLRRGLQSGDDSSYVKQVGLSGGRLVFLAETAALHSVSGEKCSLRYLMRRAWWQGRSEVRRDDWRAGLVKELRRLRSGGSVPARLVLVPSFAAAVATGVRTDAAFSREPVWWA